MIPGEMLSVGGFRLTAVAKERHGVTLSGPQRFCDFESDLHRRPRRRVRDSRAATPSACVVDREVSPGATRSIAVFLLRRCELRHTRGGAAYLSAELQDRTGVMSARLWLGSAAFFAPRRLLPAPGSPSPAHPSLTGRLLVERLRAAPFAQAVGTVKRSTPSQRPNPARGPFEARPPGHGSPPLELTSIGPLPSPPGGEADSARPSTSTRLPTRTRSSATSATRSSPRSRTRGCAASSSRSSTTRSSRPSSRRRPRLPASTTLTWVGCSST